MALHSIDGKITHKDTLQQRMGSGTFSPTNYKEGQAGGRVIMKDGQIIVNDGTNDRVLIGYQSNGF